MTADPDSHGPHLALIHPKAQKDVIPLNGVIVIGRDQRTTLRIDHSSISGFHCVIFPVPEQKGTGPLRVSWMLNDSLSLNGTYLNGQKVVKPVPLQNRDTIMLGSIYGLKVHF